VRLNELRDFVSGDLIAQFDGPVPTKDSIIQTAIGAGPNVTHYQVMHLVYMVANGGSWAEVHVKKC